ncbi:MAG: hypothetical protein LQ344_004703 [Seirophora lacunosa]|nr:MAG: hypothetical protein LQ344_004703 [Seirophora lacunosa]
MGHRQTAIAIQRRRRTSAQSVHRKRPPNIANEVPPPLRRSARLEASSQSQDRRSIEASSSYPTGNGRHNPSSRPLLRSTAQDYPIPSPRPLQRPKRPREAGSPAVHDAVEHPPKRARPLPPDRFPEQTFGQEGVSSIGASQRSYIQHWAEERHWPEAYFHQDAMIHLLARKKSTPSLGCKQLVEGASTTTTTSSNHTTREEKTAPYANRSYHVLLEVQGNSYMREYELDIESKSQDLCRKLLEMKQPTPKDTLFRDDVFRITCNRLQGKNEARIKKDLLPLIVPSAESLATLGAEHLDIVVESVDEGWDYCFL